MEHPALFVDIIFTFSFSALAAATVCVAELRTLRQLIVVKNVQQYP